MKKPFSSQLETYLRSGRIHPCLLFIGPDKENKLAAALAMAKSIFCTHKTKDLFCGQCSSCSRIDRGIFPDLLLFREEDETDLKVENVRDIIYQMEVAPLEGKAKVCIIEEAHRMNAACSNALLKTLEEPKENRFFILLSSQPGSLLPTLLSRSLQFHFHPQSDSITFTPDEVKEFESLFSNFQKNRNPEQILQAFSEKEQCLRFIQFLQLRLHERSLKNEPSGLLNHLPVEICPLKYEKITELEGKLRSQANVGLLLEGFLREEF